MTDLQPEVPVKLLSGDSFSLLGDEHWFRLVVERIPPPAPSRPPCIYGAACTRKTEAHRREYFHGAAESAPEIEDIEISEEEPPPSPPTRPAASSSNKSVDVEMKEVENEGEEKEAVLAFPSFSTATYKFDLERAAQVAGRVISDFLSTHPGKFRLVLVTLDADTEALFRRHVAAQPRFRIVRADISEPRLFGAQVLANATNTTFSGGGSGVNKALHAADSELERNTHLIHGHRAEVAKAYVVPVSGASRLASQGVTHVIHVLGPNMNPARPLCLNGNYDLGCTLLAAAYTALFNSFLAISAYVHDSPRSSPHRLAASSPPPAASPPKPSHQDIAPKAKGGGGGGGGGGWADALMDYIRHPEKHASEMYVHLQLLLLFGD